MEEARQFNIQPPHKINLEVRPQGEEIDLGQIKKFQAAYRTLTPHQIEVLALITKGKTYREIGTLLGISPRTANFHRERILRKLKMFSVVDACKMYSLMQATSLLEAGDEIEDEELKSFEAQFNALTPPERAVLRFYCDGYTSESASIQLGVTQRTNNFHIKNLFKKLGLGRMEITRLYWLMRAKQELTPKP
jgi:DNA-binding CsgD family transcriptional regulator